MHSPSNIPRIPNFMRYYIFLNSVAGITMIKFVLLLYVLYPSEFYLLVDRLPEVDEVLPKHVAVKKILYFCVSWMYVCWFYK